MSYNPYPWAYPNLPNTSVPISGQTESTYLNWKKTQEFDNVGWFLTSYVVEGGYVSKNVKQNDRIDITLTEFVLDNALQQRQAIQGIKLKNPNSTYFVDIYQGDYRVDTAHPPGIAGKDYLTLATVTTDAIGNVNSIIDTAVPRGGFRLKDEYGLFGYMRRIFNVSDYGAKGDGVTDDSQSIQAAIMAAKAAGGGLVFIPNGKYLIGKTLNFYKGINISGTSTDAVQLINQTNDTCIQFLGQEENDRLFATIDNLTITSFAKGNTLGLRVRNAGGFTLN
uniref:glycoside hydrolase family 55 protein n=1 Tax=Mycobacterium tuberculosis TaxID=1773 RepID=UPI001C01C118